MQQYSNTADATKMWQKSNNKVEIIQEKNEFKIENGMEMSMDGTLLFRSLYNFFFCLERRSILNGLTLEIAYIGSYHRSNTAGEFVKAND